MLIHSYLFVDKIYWVVIFNKSGGGISFLILFSDYGPVHAFRAAWIRCKRSPIRALTVMDSWENISPDILIIYTRLIIIC